jgi:predicted lipoprotein with Yx(FWY)xxD motif
VPLIGGEQHFLARAWALSLKSHAQGRAGKNEASGSRPPGPAPAAFSPHLRVATSSLVGTTIQTRPAAVIRDNAHVGDDLLIRTRTVWCALLAAVTIFPGGGGALAARPPAKVTIESATVAALGSVLVNARGLTLYAEAKRSASCTGGCATTWLPLLSGTAKPVAGSGLTAAKLGTVTRSDGHVQVTYNGLALYRYAADAKAGDANGQGAGGLWFAVSPSSGKVVRTALSLGGSAGPPAPKTNAAAGGAGGDMMNSAYPNPSMMSGAMN